MVELCSKTVHATRQVDANNRAPFVVVKLCDRLDSVVLPYHTNDIGCTVKAAEILGNVFYPNFNLALI